jgi:hypothetical protein
MRYRPILLAILERFSCGFPSPRSKKGHTLSREKEHGRVEKGAKIELQALSLLA